MKEPTSVRDYFGNVWRAAFSTFEGLAVTFSWMFRRPITVQYPDKIPEPIQDTLPERYRGFLEVDLDRCTGCLQCNKTCPIDCIKVELHKDKETKQRSLVRFDIDLAKCMYCGLCVEACKFDAIRHTREFEGTNTRRDNLVLHYVDAPVPVAKPKKGEDGPPPKPVGSIVKQVRKGCFDGEVG